MPRIDAATVVEHRARQHATLLEAARDLLLADGFPGLTFSTLALRTGLARPTIYAYFKTRDDLVVALCAADLPSVAAAVAAAVAAQPTPRDRLAAFIEAQLRTGHEGQYRLVQILSDAPLSPAARARIGQLHRDLMPAADTILADLGHPRPALAAMLLQGLVNAGVRAVDAGTPVATVVTDTIHIALSGLDGSSPGD